MFKLHFEGFCHFMNYPLTNAVAVHIMIQQTTNYYIHI